MLVVGVAVCQETGDRFGDFLVGEDVPQTVSSQHQDIIGPVLALRQRVNPDLKVSVEKGTRVERCMAS